MGNLRRLLSAGVAAALAACGGDGSVESSPPPTISIDDPTRLGAIATAANGALTDLSNLRGGPKVSLATVFSLLRDLRPTSPFNFNGRHVASCYSGQATLDGTVADTTGATLRPGDTFTLTYEDCDNGAFVKAGQLRVTITSSPDGAFFLDPGTMTSGVRYQMTIVVSSFAEIDRATGAYTALDGDIGVGQTWVAWVGSPGGWLESSIIGSSLAIESGLDGVAAESASLSGSLGGSYAMQVDQLLETGPGDYNPLAFQTFFTARLCSTALDGCLNVVTDWTLTRFDYDLFPSSGTLRFGDGMGRFVQVTATSGTGDVTVGYDVGAGVQGPFATTWSCLDAVDSTGCFVP